jgi:ABC-type sugar transport system ATPase subunit
MKLENISIKYGPQTIIERCDLQIFSGEIFVLMGPSGSGKSTLLKGISGLLPLHSGSVFWEKKKGSTGLVFQEARLFPHMTVMQNLAFGLRARGIPSKEQKKRVREYLEILQLQGLENRYPHQLSGGQQQRVSLGRVLVLKPDLLLLDEPFSSLDTPLRNQLTEWLYGLQKKQGFSILWVTHYIDEAYSVADRVGVMMDGKILQVGNPLDFYQNPRSEEVASFFSLPNRFPLERWHQWLQVSKPRITNEMGWIPANAVILNNNFNRERLLENTTDDQKIVWIDGVVKRVKHERNGYTVLVESPGEMLDVGGSVPNSDDVVKVGILIDKIIWYPRD